jgi:hypothetical protein
MAVSGHDDRAARCPLLGVKRTLLRLSRMSANDPKATSDAASAAFVCPTMTSSTNTIVLKIGATDQITSKMYRQQAATSAGFSWRPTMLIVDTRRRDQCRMTCSALRDEVAPSINRGQAVFGREPNNEFAINISEDIRRQNKTAIVPAR